MLQEGLCSKWPQLFWSRRTLQKDLQAKSPSKIALRGIYFEMRRWRYGWRAHKTGGGPICCVYKIWKCSPQFQIGPETYKTYRPLVQQNLRIRSDYPISSFCLFYKFMFNFDHHVNLSQSDYTLEIVVWLKKMHISIPMRFDSEKCCNNRL